MLTKTLTLKNKLGLHARSSMKLVDTASRYQANVTLILNNKRADAKDILQTMSIGAPQGTKITFEVDGTDEAPSMAAIEKLVNDYFGEGE